jgi:hypothetical protein
MSVFLGAVKFKEPNYEQLMSLVTPKEKAMYKKEYASLKKKYGEKRVKLVYTFGLKSYMLSRGFYGYSLDSIEHTFKTMSR